MRDNPELDSSLAIDYIQNRRHFTMIQVFFFLFYPLFFLFFSFFFLNYEKVCLAPRLSFRCSYCSHALTAVILADNASS